MVDESGIPCLAVKFNLVTESHADFMRAARDEISQLEKAQGADATVGTSIGSVLEAIMPVIDKFAVVRLSRLSEVVLSY